MKNIIIIITGILFLVSLVSAETIIAGGCLQVNLDELESLDNVVYDVVGNSSNLEGMTIDLNGTIASICFVINYKPDSFTIIFIDNSTKEIIVEVPSSRRSRTRIIEKETIVEVDNYIDKEIYIINETEIQKFKDDLKKFQDDLNKKDKKFKDLLLSFSILLLIFICIISYTLRKKITKLMNKSRLVKK